MNFDQWWNWDEEPRAVVDHGHTQKVPTGRHTGDIVKAEIKDLKFRVADDNPTGTSLVVTWSKSGYYPVEAIVNLRWRGLLEAVCRSAGVSPPKRGEDWDEQSLVGRVATVDIENKVAQATGTEYQRITRWHASPQKALPPAEAKPKRAPARTPAAKTHAEFQERADADDIPF
jgi:hypothetical protein